MKLKSLFLGIALLISSAVFALDYRSTHVPCAPQLQESFHLIQQLPEVRALIQEILKEGPIQIEVRNTELSNTFGAFWDSQDRSVCIAIHPQTSKAEVIRALIFELHNASVDSKFAYYNHLAFEGRISKEDYVRSMEHLEYLNSKNGARIASKGIESGLFPKDAFMPTYRNFEEHFAMQKWSGHSNCFYENYDAITRWKAMRF